MNPAGDLTDSNQMLDWVGDNMVDVAMVGAGQTKFGNHPLGLKGMWSGEHCAISSKRSWLPINRC